MTKQRTVKRSIALEGVGLQTGKPARLKLEAAPANTGINFIRTDLPNKPLLNLQSITYGMEFQKTEIPTTENRLKIIAKRFSCGSSAPAHAARRTTIGTGALQIQTTEHFLAALSGLSIDNIVAELDGAELPGLDGSAKGFVEAIKKAGVVVQDAPRKVLKVKEPVWCEGEDNLLAVFPAGEFRISYTMSYRNPALGTHFFETAVTERDFENQIAPARTFCLKAEALVLLKMGLGKGANYDNTLVIGPEGPVNNALRFPDEPVRHKVLDLIGDLYVLGMPVIGHVVAIKSGHKLNMELVKKLKSLNIGS